jgi:hypothetical protein
MTILDELDELEPDSDMTGFTASFADIANSFIVRYFPSV